MSNFNFKNVYINDFYTVAGTNENNGNLKNVQVYINDYLFSERTFESAEEKMQKEGYGVIAYEDKEAEGLIGGFVATKNDGEGLFDIEIEMITAMLFETKDAATDFYSAANQAGAVLDGKWVYWGTEDAIEDITSLF